MKKILCITANMNAGGAETFLMKIYRNLDRTQYQMDFCVSTENNYYGEEIHQLGGKIYIIPLKSKYPISSFMSIYKIVKNNQYKYVMRVNEHSLSTIDLLAARLGGANKLIMRSSNASSGSKGKVFLHKLFRFMTDIIPNIRFAPSKLAAEYSFGRNCLESGKAFLLPNGLDLKKFKFDDKVRQQYRNELKCTEKFVVGHIGRFNPQKNHVFLVKIFAEFKKIYPQSMLLLIGTGSGEDDIRRLVQDLGIEDSVKFLGVRKDIPELLCAMDIFIFPSLYEGMPNTVIEAQATGLPCLISDNITKEVAITPIVYYENLNKSPVIWVKNISNIHLKNRNEYNELLRMHGYDIQSVSQNFIKLIFN